MKRHIKSLIFLAAIGAVLNLASCKPEEPVEEPKAPNTYEFENVSYNGQTARILLVDTLMQIVKGLEQVGARSVTKAELLSIYENTGKFFSHISADKKLSDKVYAETDQQIRRWFDTLEVRSAKYAGSPAAVTTENGLHLAELIEKGLMGGLFYYQALKYMNESVPTADNVTVKEGEGTKMQHNWDEAFGYFGAARKYNEMTDVEISANPSQKDFNNDGKIDPTTERNWYYARYAGGRDRTPSAFTSGTTDFTNDIFRGFVDGRFYINIKDYNKRDEASLKVQQTWDKIIASSAIKYAEDCKNNIGKPLINKYWAEMTAFIDMTRFYSGNKLGTDKYNQVKALAGEKPADLTTEKLNDIISIMKSAYGF